MNVEKKKNKNAKLKGITVENSGKTEQQKKKKEKLGIFSYELYKNGQNKTTQKKIKPNET